MAEQQTFRMRITFAKQGRLALLSHLEVARAIERAVRRAQLPFAVSQGFSPHMKIAFGAALPVGVGGTREMVDLQLLRYVRPEEALLALQKESVPDLMVKECVLHRAEGTCGFGGVPAEHVSCAAVGRAGAAAGARAGAYHPQEEGEGAPMWLTSWWGRCPSRGRR